MDGGEGAEKLGHRFDEPWPPLDRATLEWAATIFRSHLKPINPGSSSTTGSEPVAA